MNSLRALSFRARTFGATSLAGTAAPVPPLPGERLPFPRTLRRRVRPFTVRRGIVGRERVGS